MGRRTFIQYKVHYIMFRYVFESAFALDSCVVITIIKSPKISRKILLPILGLQPIFRYLSNVHSLEAVVSGAFVGYIAFKSKHYLDRII